MRQFFEIVIANSLLATGFAVVVALVCARIRTPAMKHLLWVLVLLRLLMPPVWEIDLTRQQSQFTGWVAHRIAVQQTEVRFAWHTRWNLIRQVAERNDFLPVRSLLPVERGELSLIHI